MARLLRAEGSEVLDIQAFLGHRSPETTLNYVSGSGENIRTLFGRSPAFADVTGSPVGNAWSGPDATELAARLSRLESTLERLVRQSGLPGRSHMI